jgi:hypothetical protein
MSLLVLVVLALIILVEIKVMIPHGQEKQWNLPQKEADLVVVMVL